MDFLNNHKFITDSEFKKLEDFVIDNFKKFKNDGKSVNFAIDKTIVLIWNIFIETNFLHKFSSRLRNIYSTYIYSFENYDHTGDITMSVLKNEVFNDFKIIKEYNIVGQSTYVPEIEDLTFENFVSLLLKYDVAQKSHKRLSNNSDLYKLYYLQNSFENFTLEHFEGHVVNSDLYKKLFKKIHPEKPLPIAIQIIDEYKNTIYEIKEESEVKSKIAIKESNEKILNQIFELDEQLLILNLCISDINSIPLTEKAKLIILIGEIKDDSIFNESSSTNLVYQKINKGIQRKGSTQNMILIINSILTKIENHDLIIAKQTLKKHKTTLISEQNQLKKHNK